MIRRQSDQPSLMPAREQQVTQRKQKYLQWMKWNDLDNIRVLPHGNKLNQWFGENNLCQGKSLHKKYLPPAVLLCMDGLAAHGEHRRRLTGQCSELGRARLGLLCFFWLAAWLGWLAWSGWAWLGLAGVGWLDGWLAIAALHSSENWTPLQQLQDNCWMIVASLMGDSQQYPNNALE